MRRSFSANSKCKNCELKDPLVRNNHSPPNSNKIPKKSTETISTKPKKNKDNKTKFVSFRLNKKYHSYLEQICEELRISKTIFFSTLLENYMKENVLHPKKIN